MKKYWKSLEEYNSLKSQKEVTREPEPEFSVEGLSDEEIKGKANRRDFLKMLGFTVGYATLATSCEMPVRKAIPFLNKPEDVTPGVARFYASTYYDGNDYCSVLVKTREGRPIKIEGNELSEVTKGGTSSRVQASVLNLYDSGRLKHPLMNGQKARWEEVDQEIKGKLENIAGTGKEIVLLTSSVISPSTKNIFNEFKVKYPTTKWVTYDAISSAAILKANKKSFNKEIIPDYRFDKADLIVSFNADFLGNWLNSIDYINGYTSKRNLEDSNTMSRHIQLESFMSLTGCNADERLPVKPSEEKIILLNIYNAIAAHLGEQTYTVEPSPINIYTIAEELLANQGKSLVISGTNNIDTQLIVNGINHLLNNYGNTIDLNTPLYLKQAGDDEMEALVKELEGDKIGALLIYNCNPAYDYYNAGKFIRGLKNRELTVSFSDYTDETSQHVQFVCPDNNYLESWIDAEPKSGYYSLGQPTIPKLFDTRQFQESLLTWIGMEPDYYANIKAYWEENIFPDQSTHLSFASFWNQCLHDGVFNNKKAIEPQPSFNESELNGSIKKPNGEFELLLFENMAIGNGKHANNPWLQELPDPISKITWDNFIAVSPADASSKGWKNEDVLKINDKIKLPVLVQPGQTAGVISIAMGYGRTGAGKVGDGVGENVFPLINFSDNTIQYNSSVDLSETGGTYPLALTQTHNSMEGRDLVRETTFKDWKENPKSGNKMHDYHEERHVTLYSKPDFPNFHWGLAINLNSCIGCSACAIACQAENNVAVIGKEEVKRRRIMHWIRIDRYYTDDAENPEVYHQPVMCQQCDNAPCENVCPVAATPHSDEGLNMMAYNRCIGTRYCMNNCPYRVRRFNWYKYSNNEKFPYNMDNELGKMVLNPDVVVRSRGVVEKCSFCSQRIQEKKLEAKMENRKLKDGDIKMACEQACPANAIVFGNLNDKESRVSKAYANDRNYHLLEEIHTLPSVGYLTKVRNKETKA